METSVLLRSHLAWNNKGDSNATAPVGEVKGAMALFWLEMTILLTYLRVYFVRCCEKYELRITTGDVKFYLGKLQTFIQTHL